VLYSVPFLFFILLLLIAYYFAPIKRQWIVLLIGCVLFYVWQGGWYFGLIVLSSIITYSSALLMEKILSDKSIERKRRKHFAQVILTMAIAVVVSVIILFKLSYTRNALSLLLPIGLSYYSFQVIGYMIDIYRGMYKAEKNIFLYGLFVGYFPAMIQGPINRFDLLKKQFTETHRFDLEIIRNGLWLFLWGLFKKLVLANRCAIFVTPVLGNEQGEAGGLIQIFAVVLFVIQMYADFSGGIDMVEGISEMFGIRMYQNFNQPFFSRSIGEFWRRWHISLGNWIRDYVFYPMAFSKTYGKLSKKISNFSPHLGVTVPSMVVSIITFIIIGLWHDITPTYFVYGLWYGIFVGGSTVIKPLCEWINCVLHINSESKIYHMFQMIRTWGIVLVGESLCAVGSMSKLIRAILTNMNMKGFCLEALSHGLILADYGVVVISIALWWYISSLKYQGVKLREEIAAKSFIFRSVLVAGTIITILVVGIYGPGYDVADFIYGGI